MKKLHEISKYLAQHYRQKAETDRNEVEDYGATKKDTARAIRRTRGIGLANRVDDRRRERALAAAAAEKKAAIAKHGDLGKTHISANFRFRHYPNHPESDAKLTALKAELKKHNANAKPGDEMLKITRFHRLGKNNPHAHYYKTGRYGAYQRIKPEHGVYSDVYVHGAGRYKITKEAFDDEAAIDKLYELYDAAKVDEILESREEEEMSDENEMKGIVECVLDEDLAGLAVVFDVMAKAYSGNLLEAVLEVEGDEIYEEDEDEKESEGDKELGESDEELDEDEIEEDSTASYHDWEVKVHASPKRTSDHKVVKVRARTHRDARRYAREVAPYGYMHPLTAKKLPGTQLLKHQTFE